jgi:hypothetical protein
LQRPLESATKKTFGPGGGDAAVPIKPSRRLGFIGTEVHCPQERKFFGYFFSKK